MLPNRSINPGEMTSFNHYVFGAVADWMHRTIGGLTPIEPGYRRIEIRPRPGGGLTHCRTAHLTPYGLAECSWKIDGNKIDLDVTIPANTTASVTLPGETQSLEVGSGSWHWSIPYVDPDARGPFTVNDIVGEIMSDNAARDTVMAELDRAGAPDFIKMILFNERNAPLRQALRMLPNYEEAVTVMNQALLNISKSEKTNP